MRGTREKRKKGSEEKKGEGQSGRGTERKKG